MMEKFAEAIEKKIGDEGISITENGAVGHAVTGSPFTDFMFRISSYRNLSESEIENDFSRAFCENPVLAVKMLFLAGDIRGGLGERRTFRTGMKWLCANHPEYAEKVIKFISEYSRWDILVEIAAGDSEVAEKAMQIICDQLEEDADETINGLPVSLLAKWMPSINTSSAKTRETARKMISGLKKNGFKIDQKEYRKILSAIRSHIDVLEKRMSSNEWSEINYKNVPSKANLIYQEAFMKHDEKRRCEYLEKLEKGETKINSGVNFPHDIVNSYLTRRFLLNFEISDKNDTLEEMWKALPDYLEGKKTSGIMCVVDGSGSMTCSIGRTSLNAWCVANALGIYFSERMDGVFKNKFITFSSNPKFVDLSDCNTLSEKIKVCARHTECSNTNIEATLRLILETAIQNNLSQEEIPSTIMILSDMEFDSATDDYEYGRFNNFSYKTLFEKISDEYGKKGYKLPKIVFWNINSRTMTVPMKENENGLVLLSGFSPSIMDMVLSEELDPEKNLIKKLNSERYSMIEKALKEM